MNDKVVEIEIAGGMIYPDARNISDTTRVTFRSAAGQKLTISDIHRAIICGGSLTRIPTWIGSLSNLEMIDLASNEIERISSEDVETLARMLQLRQLRICDNRIEELPLNFGDLYRLNELYLGDNELSSLPRSIVDLTNLRILSIQPGQQSGVKKRCINIFARFPEIVLHMASLHELEIARVNMESFQVGDNRARSELVALERLDISRNPITEFPDWLLPGNTIQRLDLSHTKIRSLPDCIGRWKNLEVLDVSFSDLEELPANIGRCKKLRELRARYSKLNVVPDSIGGCERLELLDLAGTEVKTLPVELSKCMMLKLVQHKHLRPSMVPSTVWKMKGVTFEQDDDRMAIPCPIRDKYDFC